MGLAAVLRNLKPQKELVVAIIKFGVRNLSTLLLLAWGELYREHNRP